MTVPLWAWVAFVAFVVAMLAVDMLVLHRRAREVSLREAGAWSAVWVAIGLAFGGLLWAWVGEGTAQAYLAGYLIEKSLSVDNIVLFAVIFSAFAIPARYQHRVLMLGIVGALLMRAAFIAAGVALLDTLHPVIYVFGVVLLLAAVRMVRGEPAPRQGMPGQRMLRPLRRILPAADRLHGQRFVIRDGGRLLATPLLMALIVVETTDVIFAVDSIPAVLAVTTNPFVVYTSNVFALLGLRALYFLLAGATTRFRYLRPGLAVILTAVAVKLMLSDVYEFPAWSSPAFIAAVLAVVAVLSVRDNRRNSTAINQPERKDREAALRTRVFTGPRTERSGAERLRTEQPAPRSAEHPECRFHASARSLDRSFRRLVFRTYRALRGRISSLPHPGVPRGGRVHDHGLLPVNNAVNNP